MSTPLHSRLRRRDWLVLAAAPAVLPAAGAAPEDRVRSKPQHRRAPTSPYAERDDVRAFADEVAARHGLDPRWVRRQLAQAQPQPSVRRLIMPPPSGQPRNWSAYRDRFIEPQRITAGLAFWHRARPWLARAEQRFGVPPEVVVAIVGVETFYGRHVGRFRVIDALATLSFDFPPGRSDRSAFFRGELEQFLLWCRRERRDPLTVHGSYAGAIGLPQFMPGSINQYALDFDASGRIDLERSIADVVGSIARYLSTFGWTRGLATHHDVQPPTRTEDLAALLEPDILPTFTAAQFEARGAQLDEPGRREAGLLALVELENGDAPRSYVAGTGNFYAITRYNRSAYYAMAVISLAEALSAARSGGQRP